MKIIYKVLNHEFERLAVLDLSIQEVNQRIDSGIYGKKERWIRLDQATDFEKSREDDRRVIVDFPEWIEEELDSEGKKTGGTIIHEAITHVEIHVPDDFTMTPEDITEKYEEELKFKKDKKRQELAADCLIYTNGLIENISVLNKIALMKTESISVAREFLKSGSLEESLSLVLLVQPDDNFTVDMKSKLVNYINKKITEFNSIIWE